MSNNDEIMRSIGELDGSVKAMDKNLVARIEDIRSDIARLESRVNRVEDGVKERIRHVEMDVDKRIQELEKEDKRIINRVARVSGLGGGVGGALAAGVIELIKRLS